MMVMMIMICTMLFMLALAAGSYGSAGTSNGIYYFGIAFPVSHRDEEAVKAIAAVYKKRKRVITLIGFAACFLILLMWDFVSLQMVYLMVWFFTLISFYNRNLKKTGWDLYYLKTSQEWYEADKPMLRVDTAVSRQNGRMRVSMYYGLLPAALSIAVFVRAARLGAAEEGLSANIAAVSLSVCTILFLALCFAVGRSRSKVYCEDSEINLKINRSVKYEWSRCLMVQSYLTAFTAFFGSFFGSGETGGRAGYRVVPALIGSVISIFVTLAAYAKTRDAKESVRGRVYDDDDIYYLTGKKNPHQGILAEKRAGIGFSLNVGSETATEKVVIGIVMAFTLGIALFLLKYDMADIVFEFAWENGRELALVQAAGDKDSFYLDEVETVELLDKRPSMSKNNGYDGTKFYFGSFNVSGYGGAHVFICLKNSSVIVVKTADKVYIFNDESADETERIYEELYGRCPKVSARRSQLARNNCIICQ